MELSEELRNIKRSLRGVMNGPVSQSMRQKGLNYKVIFGVELPRLREIAEELPHTHALAAALWKEDIRECRLLAAMLMPTEDFSEDLAELWVEQMRFSEEAECTVFHLFARLPYASDLAFRWIAHSAPIFRLCGLLLLSRLFMQGARPTHRDADELLDHLQTELLGEDLIMRRAAQKVLLRYMEQGEEEAARGEEILGKLEG